jgi:hypothetical protein
MYFSCIFFLLVKCSHTFGAHVGQLSSHFPGTRYLQLTGWCEYLTGASGKPPEYLKLHRRILTVNNRRDENILKRRKCMVLLHPSLKHNFNGLEYEAVATLCEGHGVLRIPGQPLLVTFT